LKNLLLQKDAERIGIKMGHWMKGVARGRCAINALVLIVAMTLGTAVIWKLLG
jgi:hypothetical protein